MFRQIASEKRSNSARFSLLSSPAALQKGCNNNNGLLPAYKRTYCGDYRLDQGGARLKNGKEEEEGRSPLPVGGANSGAKPSHSLTHPRGQYKEETATTTACPKSSPNSARERENGAASSSFFSWVQQPAPEKTLAPPAQTACFMSHRPLHPASACNDARPPARRYFERVFELPPPSSSPRLRALIITPSPPIRRFLWRGEGRSKGFLVRKCLDPKGWGKTCKGEERPLPNKSSIFAANSKYWGKSPLSCKHAT